MDASAKPEKKIEIEVRNLKIEVPSKVSRGNMSGSKDSCQSDATSCISSVEAKSSIIESEVDHESVVSEQGMYYYGYYYPGSNNYLLGDWDAQYYAVAADGLETQQPAFQPDNGSVVYYFPGIQPGSASYTPFLPGTMMGSDSQYLAKQSYYPGQVSAESGFFPQPFAYGPELLPTYAWDSSLFIQDGLQEGMINPIDKSSRSNSLKSKHSYPSQKLQISRAASELKNSSPVLVAQTSTVQNQSRKLANKASTYAVSRGYAPTNKYSSFTNPANLKENNIISVGPEKAKARNNLNGSVDFNLLSEKNCGPRTNGAINAVEYGVNAPESLGDKKSKDIGGLAGTVNKEQYNLPDFPTTYERALFFVIKSYSEDDIHKSIKYNVWSSTVNGNKRLDSAFQLTQEKMTETGSKCPVFLFFSVNASGQFCGVAEMTGRVDFRKNMDFWQQDKWNGFFPVKWHIIKDIPNPQFRHIILENNDNKPVTNSRDTQEVKFAQGTRMLNIFKSYYSKTSILDDFGFYENRQKTMQTKRNNPLNPSLALLLPKGAELIRGGKETDLESKDSQTKVVDLPTLKIKEESHSLVEVKE